MATWQTDINKVLNNVGNTFNTVTSNIQNTFGTITNRAISDVNSFFSNGTTVVGINVNQIPAMKTAVRTYVEGIQSALGELVNYDPEIAFKGEYSAKLKEYIQAIIETCNAIVSHMLAFNDELTKVQQAYEAKDTASASAISADAESTRSAYTNYTESSN